MVKIPNSSGIRLLSDENPVEDVKTERIFLHTTPVGSPGTKIYAGYTQEEYLNSLQGRIRADKFDQMRRSDSQVIMLLSAVKNPIKSANWEIESADDSEEAKKEAALIRHILFDDLDQTWQEFIGEALSFVEFGHSVFERTHKVVLNHPDFGNYNGIQSLSFRSQRTIERWHVEPLTGKLRYISQYAYGDLQRLVDIPSEFLVIFNVNKEGANHEGISMIRPCYGNWFRKNEYLKFNAVGIEKFAIPTPLIEVPDGLQGSEAFAYMTAAMEHYCTHQSQYLTYPAGWKIDLHSNTYDPQKVEVSIDNEDKRMTVAFLANFLNLGMGGGSGSYALSNDLSDFFLSGIEHIANIITAKMNREVIPDLVKLNFGSKSKYPKLKVSGISDKAGKELADTLKQLSDGQYITPDDKLEVHLRKRLGITEMSNEGQRKPQVPQQSFGFQEDSPLRKRIRTSEKLRRGKIKRD